VGPEVPTGEDFKSFIIGGPVIGEARAQPSPPCLALGPGSHSLTREFGGNPGRVRDIGGLHFLEYGGYVDPDFSIEVEGSGSFPVVASFGHL
jgi:hypothetical protein